MVEAVPRGQELGLVAQVPLADAHRGVALLLEQLGHRLLLGADADGADREEHVGQRHPLGVAAGHHLCPRRRADRRGVEAGQLHPFGRHAVQARRAVELRAERPDVAVAHVVDEDHDEIGRGDAAGGSAACTTIGLKIRANSASGTVFVDRSSYQNVLCGFSS